MQITEQGHQDMAEAIRRCRLNPGAFPEHLEEYLALAEQLGGTVAGDEVTVAPAAGNMVMAIYSQFAEGRVTTPPAASDYGLTEDERVTYTNGATLEPSNLALLCQVASAFGLRMEITFVNILEA